MDGDFLILHRMQNGDDQAIESFVRKYYPKIMRYCHLHIKDSGFTEDLTQETFARFFRTLHQYQHYGKAANYLYVIAGNLCRDYYRKPEELPMEELPEHPVCLMESLDLRMDVHMALEHVPVEDVPYGSGTSSTGTAGSNRPVFLSGSPAKGNCQNFGDQSAAGEVPDQTCKRIIDDLFREGGF